MKTIENKKFSFKTQGLTKDGNGIEDVIKEISYSDLISECCNKAADPKAGFSYDDIKSIDKVKSAIAAETDGQINFEDADYEFVKNKVVSQRWMVADMQFIEFVDYIRDLK